MTMACGMQQRGLHQAAQVGRLVLAVAIERGDVVRAFGERDVEAAPQRGGLAEVGA